MAARITITNRIVVNVIVPSEALRVPHPAGDSVVRGEEQSRRRVIVSRAVVVEAGLEVVLLAGELGGAGVEADALSADQLTERLVEVAGANAGGRADRGELRLDVKPGRLPDAGVNAVELVRSE